MSLGKRLSILRKNAGLTQTQLGEILSISPQAVSKWECDISEPDLDTLRRLAALYKIPLSQVLNGDCPSTTPETAENGLFKLTLTFVSSNKIQTIAVLRRLLFCDLATAKTLAEELPSVLCEAVTDADAAKFERELAAVGAAVLLEPADPHLCVKCHKALTSSNVYPPAFFKHSRSARIATRSSPQPKQRKPKSRDRMKSPS